MPMIAMLESIQTATARSWWNAANYSLAFTTQFGNLESGDQEANPEGREFMTVNGTRVFIGKPGETVVPIDQNKIPNARLDAHSLCFLKYICAPLGLNPFHLLNDYSQNTYASDKAARISVFIIIRSMQAQLRRLYFRILWWLFGSFQAAGELPAREDMLESIDIQLPALPVSDPRQESAANSQELANSTVYLDTLLRDRNYDPAAFKDERDKVIIDAMKRAKRIKEETGNEISWQLLCGMPVSVNQPEIENAEEKTSQAEQAKKEKTHAENT
jgi:hypothetical protein